jgi:hypothetical protein
VSKHFLYLTNDKLICLVINGGKLVSRENFAISDLQTPAVEAYIQGYAASPTYLVTDLVEEDFRLDTIPHLRGSDRAAVLERKLGQIYRASPFRHAMIQGREEDGRRDDKVLLHAVTNPDLLKPLLAILERLRAPLQGIYSSAVLSGLLLKDLAIVFPHTMLVTIIPDFGLRQTYFKDDQIKFSRLTPITADESRSVGQLIAAETSRTWQYLDSLRYFTEADALDVCMLAHERDHEAIQEAIRRYPMLRYRFLDINEVATKLKVAVATAPTSSHAEELLCLLYSRVALTNHFAAPNEMRFASLRRARIALYGATAAVFAMGTAGAAFNFHHAAQISQEIDSRGRQENALHSQYQAVMATMNGQQSATDIVRETSTFFNSQIRPMPAAPGPMLNEIAQVLAGFPAIRLNQILWATNNDPGFVPTTPQGFSAANVALGGTPQVTSTSESKTAQATVVSTGAATDSMTNAPLTGNKFHIAVVEAAVQPFDGDLRSALATIERLVEALKANPEFTVKVIKRPVDPAPLASLRVIDKLNATSTQAPFTLHIARKVPGT